MEPSETNVVEDGPTWLSENETAPETVDTPTNQITIPPEPMKVDSCNKDEDIFYNLPKGIPKANGHHPSEPELEAFDRVILDFMQEQHIPGASLALSRHGKMIYVQTYGMATHDSPVEPHHRFRIASVSKVLTAIAILRLFEEGRLSLNQRVFGRKGILNQFSPTAQGDRRVLKVTVKHLLQHSGGWDRELVGDAVFWKHVAPAMGVPEPVDQHTLILYMMGQKLQFTPGLRHAYSNFGYVVLGRIIEQVTRQSYENYVCHLLTSVGITGMKLGRTRKHHCEPDEVEYFAGPRFNFVDSIFLGEGRVPAPYGGFAMETGDADGGWISTATDLVKLFGILEGMGPNLLLKPQTFKTMLKKPRYAKGSAWYSLGLDVSWNCKAWEHSGTIDGATACLVHDRHGYNWAFLCNYWPPEADYTSVIAHAITHVPSWSKMKKSTVDKADMATLDKKYCIKLAIPEMSFTEVIDYFTSIGYQCIWINGYQVKGHTYMNGIWSKEQLDCASYYGLSRDELDAIVIKMKGSEQRPCHIDSYLSSEASGQLKFSVISCSNMDPNIEWELYITQSIDDLQNKTQQMKALDFSLVRQSITTHDSTLHVAALYLQYSVGGFWPRFDLLTERYQGEFDRQARYGHMLSYVKPYTENGDTKFSAIWNHPGPYQYTSEHGMAKHRMLNDFIFAAQRKFRPHCISGYEEEGAHKYVAVCIKQVQPKSV